MEDWEPSLGPCFTLGSNADLPDFINADISELTIGDKLYITELTDGKFSILHPENTVVAQVRMSRLSLVEDEEDDEGEEGEEGAEATAEGAGDGAPAAAE